MTDEIIKNPNALHIGAIKQWSLNVNQNIRVRLYDIGYQRLADLHNEYLDVISNWPKRDAEYYKSKADSDGYTTFQLWNFMEYFGEVTGMLAPRYYDLTFLIDSSEISPAN